MADARKKKIVTNVPETFEFGAETGKILQLVIHSLYANKDIFLRELISNSSDALDKFRYESLSNEKLDDGDAPLKITIKFDEKNSSLTIFDNGIGMSRDELIENLGTIARSGTQKFLENISGNKNADVTLIGQFGVGFYSAFMVASEAEVISRKAGDEQAWVWRSKADGKYTVSQAEEKIGRGTTIKLTIKEDSKEFLDKHRISHIVGTYSDHISFPVELIDEDGAVQSLNAGKALWAKPKSEITQEQYTEFYKHVAHAGDKPWIILHNKVEGAIQYTNLLFIPSAKPFDLFHPDRATRVRLYVKKVFISEQNIDLIPRNLRFLRGIIDSEDLPLNISRETLQHNNILRKINTSITKKVLSELKDKAKKAPEEFAKFWDNFGSVLKEGLCEGIDSSRDQLLEVCHFCTTKSTDKRISLDSYIENMQEGQKAIYYLAGDSLEAIKNSPQLEGFLKKNLEVILLTDSVDDFWTTVNHEYKGFELVSINRSGLNIENLEGSAADKDSKPEQQSQAEQAVEAFKEILQGKVLNVVASRKLSDSPVCLAVQEGAMDMRMERFLLSQNQLASASLKILEINTNNPLVQFIGKNADSQKAKELGLLLFDQACVLEGEPIANPGDFAKRLNKFLEGGILGLSLK
jgi:molecular chaperone HtpG